MTFSKAIPPGYMTIGEVAGKMGVTVRTLQYYHKEGVLVPSAMSEGGRRLYTDRDVVKLHQILSLKHLGFSLDDIKNRLISLDTPADVAAVLAEQAAALRQKVETLSKSLREIEALQTEVLQMQTVDFGKYADIIVNLQMNNEFYWLIKHFDSALLDYLHTRFDKESGLRMMDTVNRLQDEALRLHKEGTAPQSEAGMQLAQDFWNMIMEFTDGDMSMLPKLMEMEKIDNPDAVWQQKQKALHSFIGPALEAYFTAQGINPFEEEKKGEGKA